MVDEFAAKNSGGTPIGGKEILVYLPCMFLGVFRDRDIVISISSIYILFLMFRPVELLFSSSFLQECMQYSDCSISFVPKSCWLYSSSSNRFGTSLTADLIYPPLIQRAAAYAIGEFMSADF